MSKKPQKPMNPRMRSSLYGMAAFYLAYLFYQIAKPYLTHDPYGPTTVQFLLGLVVLGGGAVFLSVLAWKLYKVPLPEEEPSPEEETFAEEDAEEETALPDGGDEEDETEE